MFSAIYSVYIGVVCDYSVCLSVRKLCDSANMRKDNTVYNLIQFYMGMFVCPYVNADMKKKYVYVQCNLLSIYRGCVWL